GTIESLARRHGTTRPTFIRLNYGLQRHAGGGSAVRAISILPAITGAWDDIGGGCQLSSSGTFGINFSRIERRDIPCPTRTINMVRLGEALTEINNPPVKAMIVYNSNPAAVAPERDKVLRGLRREDLFTVVLEHFQTDTADHADVLLPATTQPEHEDLHRAYGHLYVMYNRKSIEPLGEALPNSEIFRRIAAAMRLEDDYLKASDEEMMRDALSGGSETIAGITLEALRARGFMRLNVPSPHLPYASGARVPTPSGKIEIATDRAKAFGVARVPEYVPPHESEERGTAKFPLALI